MITSLEIKGAAAALVTSAVILVATFTAGGIYRNRSAMEVQSGNKPPAAENMVAKGRSFFFQSCAHCHGRDAELRIIQTVEPTTENKGVSYNVLTCFVNRRAAERKEKTFGSL